MTAAVDNETGWFYLLTCNAKPEFNHSTSIATHNESHSITTNESYEEMLMVSEMHQYLSN